MIPFPVPDDEDEGEEALQDWNGDYCEDCFDDYDQSEYFESDPEDYAENDEYQMTKVLILLILFTAGLAVSSCVTRSPDDEYYQKVTHILTHRQERVMLTKHIIATARWHYYRMLDSLTERDRLRHRDQFNYLMYLAISTPYKN